MSRGQVSVSGAGAGRTSITGRSLALSSEPSGAGMAAGFNNVKVPGSTILARAIERQQQQHQQQYQQQRQTGNRYGSAGGASSGSYGGGYAPR